MRILYKKILTSALILIGLTVFVSIVYLVFRG